MIKIKTREISRYLRMISQSRRLKYNNNANMRKQQASLIFADKIFVRKVQNKVLGIFRFRKFVAVISQVRHSSQQ